jgi:hypothetical protein
MLTSVVECESNRVRRKLVASLEALLEVSADVVPDLWAGFRFCCRLIITSRRLFIASRRLSIPKVEPEARYW